MTTPAIPLTVTQLEKMLLGISVEVAFPAAKPLMGSSPTIECVAGVCLVDMSHVARRLQHASCTR